MRRYFAIASLLFLTTVFAVIYTRRAHSSEGALSDRELAQVRGGAENSTGCKLTLDNTTCYPPPGQGQQWTCPDQGCQSVLNTQNFTGCSANGLMYWNQDFNTVQVGAGSGNKNIATSRQVTCTTNKSCKPGTPVPDQKCVGGNCQGTYLDFKCRMCSTSTGNNNFQDNWSCTDP